MVTIYDIARACGYAPATVSKALNDYKSINGKTKQKIVEAAKKMNYLPNTMARYMVTKSSFNIGVIIYIGDNFPSLKHMLFLSILDSFKKHMEKCQYDITILSQNFGGKRDSFLDHCKIRQVDGVLIFGDYSNAKIIDLLDSDLPAVGFDYLGDKASGVTSDNYEKMYELTSYIAGLGHKKIIYIKGEDNDVTALRVNGFFDALKDAGIASRPETLISGKYYAHEYMNELTKKLLSGDDKPTAIIYPDDYAALGGLGAAYETGLNVPRDISIAGFDGIDVAEIVHPYLTTVKQDQKALGVKLAQTLIMQIERSKNPDTKPEFKSIKVESRLIKGESCGKAP